MADINSLVTQLSTVSVNLSNTESGTIDDAAQKRLNDSIVLLQQLARKCGGGTPAFLTAYDAFVTENIDNKYLKLSEEIGGEIYEQAKLVKECYTMERNIIAKAATIRRPGPNDITNFFKALNLKVDEVNGYTEKRRQSKVFNQLMTVKEGIGCIGWVTVEPKPAPYLKEMYDQSLFYANRVIKELKGVNDKHVEWVRSFTGSIKNLEAYVGDNHPTGIQWNVQSDGDVLAPTTTTSVATAGGSLEAVTAFDAFVSSSLDPYLNISKELGGDIAVHAEKVKETFAVVRKVLEIAAVSKQPSPDALSKVVQPLSAKVTAVVAFCEKNRGSKFFNHLMTVKDGISCAGWVTVSPKPVAYLKESQDQAMFYGNRVIKDYKGKDEKHVQWMKSYIKVIADLKEYVGTYHKTGLVWNPQGKEVLAPTAGAAPPPGGAPPPPPPPPAVENPVATVDGSGGKTAQAALFSQINQGGAVTSGLKKVTADMQTHKNPTLRQGAKPFSSQAGVKPVSAPKSAPKVAKTMPPKLELINKKWVVEYQKNNADIVIDGEMKHTAYIYKCENSTIRINNKVNSITVDSCKKTALIFEQCLGSVDLINCQSVQMQVTGKVPIVSIDKTDGAMVYLSADSLDAVIMTAKSSEMNILVPKDGGEFEEFPLPEQFKSTYNGKIFYTSCNESLG